MNCPACGIPDSRVFKSIDDGTTVTRLRRCMCGVQWRTDEVVILKTLRTIPTQGQTPVATNGHPPPPVATNPPSSSGGVGGGLSGIVQETIPETDPNPGLVVNPKRARERKPRTRTEPDYEVEFLELWRGCDLVGTKLTAQAAWREVGRPRAAEVITVWKLYRASVPLSQSPLHVSTWLRAFGHRQEWVPLPARATTPITGRFESAAVRAEREHRATRARTEEQRLFGKGA